MRVKPWVNFCKNKEFSNVPRREKVVNFLRRYRPSLPPRPIDEEEQLMQMIREEKPVNFPKLLPLLGLITGITALSVLIVGSIVGFILIHNWAKFPTSS